jgi:cell division protein ZapA (FtsZ GTPase activity inhibitor)
LAKTTKASEADYETLKDLRGATHNLIRGVRDLHERTRYEDLEHAVLGLEIVDHALEEVEENKGIGGNIEAITDPTAHKAARSLLAGAQKLQKEANLLLKTRKNEDLETAIKALEISKGSLEEVLERYK